MKKTRHYSEVLDAPVEVRRAILAAAPPGTTQIECEDCDEEASAKVDAKGRMTLPPGWRWSPASCNWGDGVTLRPKHKKCPDE